ncbi:hypothetical protein L3Q82_003856 [Scortum barcoo]|uniref:Uncharacterized protein n=1 Tax=Scortum barcoo TaxID=214431 RepID=A0ACB8X7N2_9TELE|nr:hypothetical protein L3Q82_003856 [Scortum barcoo]
MVNERVASLRLRVGDRSLAVVCAYGPNSSTEYPQELNDLITLVLLIDARLQARRREQRLDPVPSSPPLQPAKPLLASSDPSADASRTVPRDEPEMNPCGRARLTPEERSRRIRAGPPVNMGVLAGHAQDPNGHRSRFQLQATICYQLQHLPLQALVDSGAEENFLDLQVAAQAGVPFELLEKPRDALAVDGKDHGSWFPWLATHIWTGPRGNFWIKASGVMRPAYGPPSHPQQSQPVPVASRTDGSIWRRSIMTSRRWNNFQSTRFVVHAPDGISVLLPARYADYEVEHLGYSGQRYREDVEVPQREGRAKMTPLTSAYDSSPPSRLQRRDAIPQDMDLCHGAEGQQHIQENQLAPLLSPESELREQDGDRFTPLHPTLRPRPPPEDIKAELEDIRHERRLLQWTQQRMASDLAELRTLRADMRKLVDAVQNLPSPSTPHTSKPELELPPPLAEPDGVEEDDWPAPPPWPDPAMETLLPDKPPQVKEEVVPTPITQPFESQPPGQQSAYDTSHYLRPWLKLVQPLPQPCTLPPPEFGYHTGYSAPKSEPGCNPHQLPSRSWMQPPPSGLFPGRNSSVTESGYYGPRPSIRNFSRRDPSEFARLKLSLENLLPPEATELFKYQVLVDHLQLEEAQVDSRCLP